MLNSKDLVGAPFADDLQRRLPVGCCMPPQRCGLETKIILGNLVFNMYAKCQSMEDAWQVSDEMPHRDLVSWRGLISSYVQNGFSGEALRSFREMQCSAAVCPLLGPTEDGAASFRGGPTPFKPNPTIKIACCTAKKRETGTGWALSKLRMHQLSLVSDLQRKVEVGSLCIVPDPDCAPLWQNSATLGELFGSSAEPQANPGI